MGVLLGQKFNTCLSNTICLWCVILQHWVIIHRWFFCVYEALLFLLSVLNLGNVALLA